MQNALVVYKNKPALVKEKGPDKIIIVLPDGVSIKVREKDVEVIHPGPVRREGSGIGDWGSGIEGSELASNVVRETWELLLAEEGSPISLKELAELVFDEYSPASAWAAFCLLTDGLYFSGTVSAIHPRQQDKVEADEKKRAEKQQASGERELFLERLRKGKPILFANHDLRSPIPEQEGNLRPSGSAEVPRSSHDDRRFIQDVEALAYGKSVRSRTMKDLGLGETPEDAHALLLRSGFWTEQINPHPGRFGISLLPAQHIPDPPPEEGGLKSERRDLTHLAAFAIDSPWSHDPDDAVSLETKNGKQILYVHVADPAASIRSDSPPEREARDRGATLYIPEGAFRMIAKEALSVFALGLAESSPALTFKMTLNNSGEIEDTEIFPSTVKVLRLTYKEVDEIVDNRKYDNAHDSAHDCAHDCAHDSVHSTKAAVLRDLCLLAERNFNRRRDSGAINIDLTEVHISLKGGKVTIVPIAPYRSADMVRECMLLAGEGAGIWAMQRNVPFPYIEQEIAEIPNEILPGMAGSYQLRRCMRPRLLSVKPGRHGGLGLDVYTQVTSPLRRYTDLLAHIQIRALLRGGEILSPDEVAARLAASEAAAAAVTQAERASRNHWIMVYLSDKKDSVWDALAMEKKGNRMAARWTAIIPALALETQVSLRKDVAPNETLKLILRSVNIPKGEAVFVVDE